MSKPPGGLTTREFQVALALAEERPAKEIAFEMGLAVKTVEFHKNNVYAKLGVRGSVGVARWLIRHGHVVA